MGEKYFDKANITEESIEIQNSAHLCDENDYIQYLEQLPKDIYIMMLQNSYIPFYLVDIKGTVVYTNPTITREYGIKPHEIIGKNTVTISKKLWTPSVLEYGQQLEEGDFIIQKNLYTGELIKEYLTPIRDKETNEKKYILTVGIPHLSDLNRLYSTFSKEIKNFSAGTFYYSTNPLMNDINNDLEMAAKSDIPVLILGESGTGKTKYAEIIHFNSARKDKNFFVLNCTAIPESLFESELFGYAPNAFTGASAHGKKGVLEVCNGGTLFLDEIGDLPLSMQAKILDVVENKRFMPIGSNEIKKVDIRIITATNKDLEELVEKGVFRSDLYYRISSVDVKVLPLRERKEDVLPLSNMFLEQFNKMYKVKKYFSDEMINAFLCYSWPGNVRELRNTIERLIVLSKGNMLSLKKLPDKMINQLDEASIFPENEWGYDTLVRNVEDRIKKSIIEYYYKKNKTIRATAEAMQVSKSKAQNLISKYCKKDNR